MFGKRSTQRVAKVDRQRLSFESLENRIVLSATGLEAPSATFSAASIVAPAHALLDPIVAWVQALNYTQFNLLTSDTVQHLLPSQVASIPNSYWFELMNPGARGAMNAPQVQALNVASIRLTLLTPQQVNYLTVPQIKSVYYYDFHLLTPAQVPYLTTTQIASIPTSGYFGQWSAASRAALTQPQVQSLNVSALRIDRLTAQQVPWLTVPQIQSLAYYDFQYLHVAQIVNLTPAQIATIPNAAYFGQMSAAARERLTAVQVRALNVDAIGLTQLTGIQLGYLTAVQLRAVKYWEFQLLTPVQMPYLTPAQIASIPNAAFFGQIPAASRAALIMTQVQALNVADLGITLLTPQQVGVLSAPQLRALKFNDFQLLAGWQIPYLTTAQIASVPTSTHFALWSEEARRALTAPQVQALDVDAVRINWLSPQQSSWLTIAQIRSLEYWDFPFLSRVQTPYLTTAQIASIPGGGFSNWSESARAALTATQMQAVNMADMRLNLFTSRQIGWLTTAQVRQVGNYDFEYLNPSQIPLLSAAQLATITSPGHLELWSPEARAALTLPQIRLLNVAQTRINLLTTTQISWLTVPQIQSLGPYDFEFLSASQIPSLSLAQVSSIPNGGYIAQLPSHLQAALTREQMLSLPYSAWSSLGNELEQTPPTDYHPTMHTPIGPDGIPISEHLQTEADKFFALVPLSTATHVTVASGNWNDPAVWRNGIVPSGPGDRVAISAGTTVNFNVSMNYAIGTLRIDGTLSFATNRNTLLEADTIVVTTTGKLYIGTAANPIQDAFTAKILISDNGPINTAWDPYLLSRGVISRGEVRMYGKTVTPYVELAVEPSAGDTTLQLAEIPVNWKVGDRLVVSGVYASAADFGADEVTIRAINGKTVTVDRLIYNHHTPEAYGVSVYVANLSRNIVLAAEDPSVIAERPHLVFIHNTNVQIDNIAVEGFGRTDKSIPINDPVVVNGVLQPGTGTNPRARYAMHFHHTGVNSLMQTPAVVRGSVVSGSPGWGFVNHSSYVNFENNISYEVNGSGFVAEDGNEIGSMRNNLALNTTGAFGSIISRRAIHDFGFSGDGFWLQGPGIEMTGNIASGAKHAGFAYYTSSSKTLFDAINLDDPAMAAGNMAIPVGTAPLAGFANNTAFGVAIGLGLWYHQTMMTDGNSNIDNFTSWNTTLMGIDLAYTSHVTIRNARLVGDLAAYKGVGVGSNGITGDITIQNINVAGFEVGIDVPDRRSTVIENAFIAAVQGIYIDRGRDTIRNVDIRGSIYFASLNQAQLAGRTQWKIYLIASNNIEGDFFGRRRDAVFAADTIRYAPTGSPALMMAYYEQYPYYTPFPTGSSSEVPSEYLNKTVQQLELQYGLKFKGGMPAANVTNIVGVRGYVYAAPAAEKN